MAESQIATVEYQIGTYIDVIKIGCTDESDDADIIAVARKQISHGTALPMGYESWTVIERDNDEAE